MNETRIKIQQLKVLYEGGEAIRDISLTIPDRQITAIIGPSGCGKTTLLRSINRLIDSTDGLRETRYWGLATVIKIEWLRQSPVVPEPVPITITTINASLPNIQMECYFIVLSSVLLTRDKDALTPKYWA